MTEFKQPNESIELAAKITTLLRITTGRLALPLFLGFGFIDYLYAPHLAVWFLGLRCMIIPFAIIVRLLLKKNLTFKQLQGVALLSTFFQSMMITIMAFVAEGGQSIYYAGLNLVCIGMVSFIPWASAMIPLALCAVYGPYALLAFFQIFSGRGWREIALNFSFMFGTAILSTVIRVFQLKLERSDFESRLELYEELKLRNEIVKQKTSENIKLHVLSRNFSPQVVDAIMRGKMELASAVRRTQICSFFVDIADSTKKILSLEEAEFAKSIERFLDIVMAVAANFDATIDKFNGDQIVAFSNDPVAYADYVERTVTMAFVIRDSIAKDKNYFERHWGEPMRVYIGIAAGPANVGFYGNKKIMQSYTALGPPVNLAARLCGEASHNEILISREVADVLNGNPFFELNEKGFVALHGFDEDCLFYSVAEVHTTFDKALDLSESHTCTKCRGRLTLYEKNFVWHHRCIICGHVPD